MAAPVERVARACSELEKLLGEDSGNGEVGLEGEVIIRRLTDMFREETYRELAEERIFRLILQTLSRVSREIKAVSSPAGAFTESRCQFSAECFRCLRNACVQCVRNQDNVRNVGLIEESVRFIRIFSDPRVLQEPALVAFRCGLQFLGNAAAGNRDSQNAIWACAFPDIFSNCLMHNDEKVVIYSSMVLFTCISRENRSALQDPSNIAVALNVITAYRKYPDAEWIYLIVVEHLLLCPDLVESMYLSQSSQDRVSLLELILAKISQKDPHPDEDAEKLQVIATFLSNCFQTQCKTILKLTSPSACDEQETFVVIRLLDILCEMTSKNEYLSCLQTCPGLLESTVDILRLTHLAGKQSKNVFTATHTMSMGQDLTHAAVGFKAHLIRLIGNLCYQDKENQDKVYQLDGIALILDNCSIDDNNPFLNQWAVFTIRNLTENNDQNQELIASMERQGLADSSLLKSMGLQAEERDGKLLLKSLKKSPAL